MKARREEGASERVRVTESGDVDRESEEAAIARATLHVVMWNEFATLRANAEMMERQTRLARKHGVPILVLRTDEAPLPPWVEGAPVLEARTPAEAEVHKDAIRRGRAQGAVMPPLN